LEYPAVLREIASFTVTPLGREKVVGLSPVGSVSEIEEAFKEYSEARDILKVSGKLPLAGVADTREVLGRIDPAGAFLLPEELIQIRTNLEAVRELKTLSTPSFSREHPIISSRIETLSELKPLYSELLRILDDKGQIKDTASHELYSIRKEIKSGRDRARSILEDLCKDKKYREYLQEDFITIRDDRYVLSIKTGKHVQVSGIIHGRSGSGATYFIEPMQLVELNNRIAILKKEEKSEEIEILKAATNMVAPERGALLNDLSTLAALDSLQAKALFAGLTNSIVPVIKAGGAVKFREARHPLLIMKELRGGDRVVPINLEIPDGKLVLVISGANTGGKTVALKTLGLFTLMALSAIPVPAAEGSEAVAFCSIFSDIGDRQDIIESLSTFSAHVKRIRYFLTAAKAGSLVLVDEIGAGTDPTEGSALALAIIETLKEIGAVTVITTHSNIIKAHAQVDPDYLNASVEFDENTLKPLYELLYGVPGPSLGLSIAQSLGMPSRLIEKARTYFKEKEAAFIESVRLLEEEKEEIRKLRERLTSLEEKREKAVTRLRAERGELLKKAKGKVDSIVKEAEEEIRETVRKIREEKAKAVSPYGVSVRVQEIGSKAASRLSRGSEIYVPSEGDKVAISGSNTRGVVLRIDEEGRKAELMVGSMKVWVAWNKLNKRGGEGRTKARARASNIDADIEPAASINVIGMRVEEAVTLVTRFLDNAHASGLGKVEIIHGIGTGRLARGIEEYLSSNPVVAGFHHGDQSRGGAGVTIVELA
jgi:DNA mismatch repair protein MutS2